MAEKTIQISGILDEYNRKINISNGQYLPRELDGKKITLTIKYDSESNEEEQSVKPNQLESTLSLITPSPLKPARPKTRPLDVSKFRPPYLQ